MNDLSIIAGPCSIGEENKEEINKIARLEGVAGVRVVGLKSRTALDETGKGMGMDYEVYKQNQRLLKLGEKLITPPSVEFAKDLFEETGIAIATEIMNPNLQISHFEGWLPERKLLAWQPSVNQLGWTVDEIRMQTQPNGWIVGIKNGKWTGTNLEEARCGNNTIEATWKGLSTFAKAEGNQNNVKLIHRGFDIPEKGNYRNMPIHEIAERVKLSTGLPMMFDPSHSYGPKLVHEIVDGTVEAMRITMSNGLPLYDGILIEVGTSTTDTDQHITLSELDQLIDRVAQFRNLVKEI
jgi:3-deoxy-D-arabino-heptulosonate 7-phosphate (DAHP) synthase